MIKGAPEGSEQSTVTELAERLQLAQSTVTEPVRLEEMTEIDVRQQAGVRRVPCAFEAIDLERGERVDGRDLILDHDRAAQPRDADELRDDELGPRDVVQRAPRHGEVEREGLERQRRRVGFHERD